MARETQGEKVISIWEQTSTIRTSACHIARPRKATRVSQPAGSAHHLVMRDAVQLLLFARSRTYRVLRLCQSPKRSTCLVAVAVLCLSVYVVVLRCSLLCLGCEHKRGGK